MSNEPTESELVEAIQQALLDGQQLQASLLIYQTAQAQMEADRIRFFRSQRRLKTLRAAYELANPDISERRSPEAALGTQTQTL
jgi:hypothetical protein